MNYSQFLNMIPEATLMVVLLITFIADFCSSKSADRKWFNPLVCLLMVAHIVINIFPTEATEAFGGMYTTGPAAGVLKTILALGTLIVMVQAKEWLSRKDTAFKEGEFYMLIISTLLGMNMMVSANHFLLFFLGLEMASVPMACLVAFDKYRHNSAEAGAKFILTATFSSGVMIYGISLLYAACGTLYFDDVAKVIFCITIDHRRYGILLQWSRFQDFLGSFPLLDSRFIPGRTNYCYRLLVSSI